MPEVNFDGLIGPTHNYSGLSDGNIASKKNFSSPSYPKKAALQGIKKAEILIIRDFNKVFFFHTKDLSCLALSSLDSLEVTKRF